MKSILQYFFIAVLVLVVQKKLFAQNTSQVVKLTVTSQGSSREDAKNNALRNAIQQTVGVFISTNTTLLNDNLVKDEIISISNGTIQKYLILNEGELSNGIYFVTLNADVSVTKLRSFIENKGVKSSFNGSLFSFNIKQKELATINETKAIQDLKLITDQLLKQTFEYDLKVGEPKNDNGEWVIPVDFKSYLNFNFISFYNLVIKTIESLSLPQEEQNSFKALGLPSYGININGKVFYFRNLETLEAIVSDIIFEIPKSSFDFKLMNNVQNISLSDQYYYRYNHIMPNIYKYYYKIPRADFDLLDAKVKNEIEQKLSIIDENNQMTNTSGTRTVRRIVTFNSTSSFQLISFKNNDRNGEDFYHTMEECCGWGAERRGLKYFNIEQFFYKKEEPLFGKKEERKTLNIFISKNERNLIKKINSASGNEMNDFKVEFSNTKLSLKFTNHELNKLDGFEIKKN